VAGHQKYWLIDMPLSQYSDDVKKLARDNNLAIIDSRFKDTVNPNRLAQAVPSLTKKRKRKAKQQEEQQIEPSIPLV
jgi:hypothetical protein